MSGRRFGPRRTAGRGKPSRSLPALEALEDRQLLATFTVTNTLDGGGGSLRAAITTANTTPGADVIAFNIAGTGVHTIQPSAALPALTEAVRIDGTTQPGYSSQPLIELDGVNAGVGTPGLRFQSPNDAVVALTIKRFSGAGVRMESSAGVVQLCLLGTDSQGGMAANGNSGIFVVGANNVIGGFDSKLGTLGNVISGNSGGGVNLFGTGASGNTIVGNFIGTSGPGAGALPNAGDGITINGGAFNQIGGLTAGQANVISGNTGNGITILGSSARSTTVLSNFIGVDGNPSSTSGGGASGGKIAIPNGGAGVSVVGAPLSQIGGADGGGNIISGNKGAGIQIVGGDTTFIQGNIIGADSQGVGNLGNLGAGVAINGGDNSQIGGTLDGAGNVIAFNGATFQDGGVNIFSGRQISILSNSIFDNFGLGIKQFSAVQNPPVLTRAATAAGRTLIQGSIDSSPNSIYMIQFFTNPTADPSGFGEGKALIGQTQVTTDDNGHADLNVTLPVPAVLDQFISATATDSQGNTSEFSDDATIVQANQANLSVLIDASPNPATLGSSLTYTLTIINSGPDTATNVKLVQSLPSGVTVDSATATQGTITTGATSILGDLGSIDSGSSVTVTVVVTPGMVGSITTTATVSSAEIDPDDSDDQASQTTVVDIPVDLSVSLAAQPPSVTVGQNTTIMARVSNLGPGVATGTILHVTLPAGVSFMSVSLGQGTASFSNGIVTALVGTLARGTTVAVNIVVMAPITVPDSGVLSIAADVAGNEIETQGPDSGPNQATLDIPVLASSDLALSFTADAEPILAGSNLTYTYTIVNNGPSPATGVVLTDALPEGMTFVAAPPPSQGTATMTEVDGVATITVAVGALNPGGVATGTIVVIPTKTGVIPNVATVALDQADPDPGNNSATAVSTVSPADLSVNTSVAPDPVEAGRNLTYTLFVKNNGPADATNVNLTDVLPANVVFVSGVSGQGTVSQLNGQVTAVLGTIPSGTTVPVTIVITPRVSAALTNTASISSDQIDVNPADNSQTVTTFVSPADLGVTLAVAPGAVLAGDTLTYTAVVTNAGPFAATNVVLNDLLPAGLQFISATASQGKVASGPAGVDAQIGNLPAGGSVTVTIVAKPQTEGQFNNSVTVTSDDVDSAPGNNTAQASATVTNGPGVLQFAAGSFSAAENSGSAVITVVRTSGNRGVVSVNFSTTDGTGHAGSNYKPVSGTLVFNDGETVKTFSVPLLDDGVVNGDTTIHLSLTAPTGGAIVGGNSAATLVSSESDFDLTGPTVLGLQTLANGRVVTGVTLAFDEALDPATATNPGNYTLLGPGKRGRGEVQVAILPPTYDPLTHTVTITSARPLALNNFYRVIVHGGAGAGVTDIFNNPLRGDQTGSNGRDFAASFARGSSLRYRDHDGDRVSLNLSNRGLLDLTLNANGEGQILRVLGAGRRRSVLTGNVKRGSFNSDGVTTYQAIVGANFGQVDSRLTTPKFFVDSVTEFISGRPSSQVRAATFAGDGSPARGRLFAKRFARRHHR